MPITCLFLAAAVAGVNLPPTEVESDSYRAGVEQWHAERVERLKAPGGWLSLVGLAWLQPGANSVGSAADNDVVLPNGPAHLGVINWQDNGTVNIKLADGSTALIDGKPQDQAVLLDDSHEEPTQVRFGSTHFYLIERSGKKGLRIKDPEAPARISFQGIDRYPVDPSWRIEAQWVPFDPPQQLQVATQIDTLEEYPVPGKLVFERDGQTYTLLPVLDSPDAEQLFVMFADRTSGKETYGAGRFLYIDRPENGKVVIDFNKAYNPPCVFTPYAACPLAPPENRMDLRVTAGEKNYHGGK